MTQALNPAFVAGILAIAWLFFAIGLVGVVAWLLEPMFYPGSIDRVIDWFQKQKFPPTEPTGSYSDDGALRMRDIEDPWKQPPESEVELEHREFSRGLERQRK